MNVDKNDGTGRGRKLECETSVNVMQLKNVLRFVLFYMNWTHIMNIVKLMLRFCKGESSVLSQGNKSLNLTK